MSDLYKLTYCVDEIHFAPPKKPRNDDSRANTLSVHGMYILHVGPVGLLRSPLQTASNTGPPLHVLAEQREGLVYSVSTN